MPCFWAKLGATGDRLGKASNYASNTPPSPSLKLQRVLPSPINALGARKTLAGEINFFTTEIVLPWFGQN